MLVQLCTVDEAAARLNTTPRFVRRLIAERRIAFVKLGRHIRIPMDVLDEFHRRRPGRTRASARVLARTGPVAQDSHRRL